MPRERFDVKVLGEVIGTCDGWDQVTDHGLQFYNFKPDNLIDYRFKMGEVDSIFIDPWDGIVETYNDAGEVIQKYKDFFLAMHQPIG